MSIRVLFFGVVADQQGSRETKISSHDNMTLADVIDKIAVVLPNTCLIALNQQQQYDMTHPVHDGDEIAIMPPFSGG